MVQKHRTSCLTSGHNYKQGQGYQAKLEFLIESEELVKMCDNLNIDMNELSLGQNQPIRKKLNGTVWKVLPEKRNKKIKFSGYKNDFLQN